MSKTFWAPAHSSQAHRRDDRTGSRYDYENQEWSLAKFIELWDRDKLHLDVSIQRPQDLFSDATKTGITTTVINNGAIHQIQIHGYTVDGVWHYDVYNGGNRIDFLIRQLIGDKNIFDDDEKFFYTSPADAKHECIKQASFDAMPEEVREKIRNFDGIQVELVSNLSDEELGIMMRQGNTTEPMNEAHESNTVVGDYRNYIRVSTMDKPMCASPVPGLSQHSLFASLLKNNSKKALGHFQLVSWLGLPRFNHIYLEETIYDGVATNTTENRKDIFIGPNDSLGVFAKVSCKQENADKFSKLAKAITGDLDRYELLWNISKKDKNLDFNSSGSLSGASKMGPMYFLLGLEQNCVKEKTFRLKDPVLFLNEYTKAHRVLKQDVTDVKTGKESKSDYANRQGGWSAEDWKVKNGLLYHEMMKDKDSLLDVGIVFCDSRRKFSKKQKIEMSKEQDWKCAITGKKFTEADIPDMDADHIFPWSKGGPTEPWNGRMISRKEHQELGFEYLEEPSASNNETKRKVA